MKSKMTWMVVCATIGGALTLLMAQSGSLSAKPSAVAVVNVSAALNGLEEKTKLEADLQAEASRLTEEQAQRAAEVEQLQSDLDFLDPDSESYAEKSRQLDRAKVELQAWSQYHQRRVARQSARQILNLYQKMLGTIDTIATNNGYDVVLFKDQPLEGLGAIESLQTDQVSQLIERRKLLWAADALDITETVRQRMDADFQAGR